MTTNKQTPLSEKVIDRGDWRHYKEEDVRDAVRRLLNYFEKHITIISKREFVNQVKEIFGKELCEDNSQEKYAPENSDASAESYNLRSETTARLTDGKTVNVSDNQTLDTQKGCKTSNFFIKEVKGK